MPSATFLIQGQENTRHLLSHFVIDEDGWLTDPSEVAFAIDDETGTQQFPGAGWEDVTTGDGKVDTGYFYAYDAGGGSGWTPDPGASVGEWTIRWRWKLEAGDDYSTWSHKFQIEDSTIGFSFDYRTLISPAQVRAEGITTTTLSNARLGLLIDRATQYIERMCGVHFRPIHGLFKYNGNWSEALFLQVPIVGVKQILANGGTTPLNTSAVALHHSRIDQDIRFNPSPDPRRNPWIRFKAEVSIFAMTGSQRRRPRFSAGAHMQKVTGVFGFLETDGTVPALITDAVLRLIYNTALTLTPGGGGAVAGPLISETVDRHTKMWASGGSAALSHALATSKEVEEIITLYRRPIGLGTTAPIWPLPLDGSP